MRTACLLVFFAKVALIRISFIALPADVAIHFGAGGVPDAGAS